MGQPAPLPAHLGCEGRGLHASGQALTRELAEEVGVHNPEIGPQIWTRTHVAPMSTGHDGQREDSYLVRTASFVPRPALTTAQLRAET
jgi:8-oxo-dGTP diphosphatase